MNHEIQAKITIVVKLFAIFQEVYGASELKLQFPPNTTVSMVLERIIAQHPELQSWQDKIRFGINFQFVDPQTLLNDGDEVVLIPPVSGG